MSTVQFLLRLFGASKANGSQTLLFVSFIRCPPARWANALSQVSISGFWPLDTLFLVAAKHKQGVPFLQWDVDPPRQITADYFLRSQQPNVPLELLRPWNMEEEKVFQQANPPPIPSPPVAVAGQWMVTTWAGSARVWSHRSSLRAAAVRTAFTNRLQCLYLTKELQMGDDNFISDEAGLTVTIKRRSERSILPVIVWMFRQQSSFLPMMPPMRCTKPSNRTSTTKTALLRIHTYPATHQSGHVRCLLIPLTYHSSDCATGMLTLQQRH